MHNNEGLDLTPERNRLRNNTKAESENIYRTGLNFTRLLGRSILDPILQIRLYSYFAPYFRPLRWTVDKVDIENTL